MSDQDNRTRDIRPATVAGTFYPDTAEALREAITQAFHAPLGPRDVPAIPAAGPRRLIGIVAPHAGYQYSAPCAAWAYAAAARDGQPAAVVILGVNHRGIGAPLAVSPAAGWQTPLGEAPVATALRERLLSRLPGLRPDARAHQQEHSLEVQAPFVQYLFGNVPILPIALGAATPQATLELGQALAELAGEADLLIVASTDFSHYITHEEATHRDRLALDRIAEVDPAGLIDTVYRQEITMCGVLPVATLLAAAQALGARQAEILQYYTSGDITGDRRQVVGYGAAAIAR